MRRIIAVALVCLLAACDSPAPSPSAVLPSPKLAAPSDMPSVHAPMALPEYPIIDGSSSTVNMHAAIRQHFTGLSLTDAHSQTYDALERLIPGNKNPADVLLTVKHYDSTIAEANGRGADLVITPIAKEGFVFITTKDNPVKSLTSAQVRDIFAGYITNWKNFTDWLLTDEGQNVI